MRIGIWAIALALFATASAAAPEREGPRVILHTVAGDLVLALYPKVAPKTVEQFLALSRNGVYDSAHFRRLEPGFVLQTGAADDRATPLTATQRAMIHTLRGEYATDVRHRRGVLSLARPDNDPDGGQTSFSILLGDAPHLDGQYTVFGELESGADVLAALERAPMKNGSPALRLTIESAEVVDTPEALRAKVLRRAVPLTKDTAPSPWSFSKAAVATGLVVVLALVALSTSVAVLSGRGLRPALFFSALIGGFALFLYLTPLSVGRPWFAAAILLGCAGLFRAMSFFESPPRRSSKTG